jgi:hypothetical protein
MQSACFDYPLQKWFDFKVPRTGVAPDFIQSALSEEILATAKDTAKVVFLGSAPSGEIIVKTKKGTSWEKMSLTFRTRPETISISVDVAPGEWLLSLLKDLAGLRMITTVQAVRESYERAGLEDFELFWMNKPVSTLYRAGLLQL